MSKTKRDAETSPERLLSDEGFVEQWRLSEVEMANWGSFNGFHRCAVSRRRMLITGDSGTGKSTILDAIAAVLTPPRDLRLNAAASTEAKRSSTRSVVSYIRGAYGAHSTDEGEVRTSYLRGGRATWSGVLLRFEKDTDDAEPVNLVGIYFQKANSNDSRDTSVFYATVRGDIALSELEAFGIAGADMTAFNKAFEQRGKGTRKHSVFCASFCSLLGIAGPETLTLLHKIQAAKDMGSLDKLFRDYMLERPKTFELATEAVELFGELEQAHNRVIDQRKQMEALEPLPELIDKYQAAMQEESSLQVLCDALNGFTSQEAIDILKDQCEIACRKRDSLRERLESYEQECSLAQENYNRANEALTAQNGGSSYNGAELAMNDAKRGVLRVQRERNQLAKELRRAHLATSEEMEVPIAPEVPDTLAAFEALKRYVANQAGQMRVWLETHGDEKVEKFGKLDSLKRQVQEYENEARHLRKLKSNIPSKLHAVRMDLVRHLGISHTDLPFCGELIDVRADQAQWRGAIERVLHSFARTLLVECDYAPMVAEYLERHHLGLRFEYDVIPNVSSIDVPQRSLSNRSLLHKIDITESKEHPGYSRWLHKRMRERFDYQCVDEPAEMASHTKALTRAGQVKSGQHHIKDDRHRINDASNWALGSTNDGKIADLEAKKEDLAKEMVSAVSAAQRFDEKERSAKAIMDLNDRLADEEWQRYDLQDAEENLKGAQKFLAVLKNNPKLAELEAERARADERLKAATQARNECAGDLRSALNELSDIEGQIDARTQELSVGAEEDIDDASRAELRKLFVHAAPNYRTSISQVFETQLRVNEKLHKAIETQQRIQQESRLRTEKIMQHYKEGWPSESAELSTDFADAEAYFKRFNQIKASGLPTYEHKFLEVLNDFSQDQVTTISSEIRNAFRDIRDKLEPVNRSLLLSEFSPGIHLRIEVQEHKTARVKEFLSDLKEIASGAWSANDATQAYERYSKTAVIMKKLSAPDHASQTWRSQCLDTRTHVRFIAQEVNANGDVVNVHSTDGGLSGGERQKLVLFCLAAALRYQLADEDAVIPSYGTIILDEAFDKSDRTFAKDTLLVFERFGFHMVLVTPNKLIQVLEDHIGSVGLVSRTTDHCSHIQLISFDGFEDQRSEEKTRRIRG